MDERLVDVTVVMPCLNEEEGVGVCIDKVKEVFSREKINGEIIVVDNGSLDRSKEVSAAHGARLIEEPVRGYGAAYLKGLSEAKGKYIVMGDSDDSYDFRDTPKLLKPLREGCDLVMGSRFKGKMKKGAMSWTHRYIGNPILSGICRLFFNTRLSDIHCGMRALTKDAYLRMHLSTAGMEFATEMVVSALTNNLKICEVAIDYNPRIGESKLMPLADAWRHIRFMLIFSPVWLYFIPGALGSMLGFIVSLFLLKGPVFFLGRYWDAHLMIFSAIISILSYQILHLGIYAHTFAIRQGFIKYDPVTLFFKKRFNLERGLILGGCVFIVGLLIFFFVFAQWFFNHFGPLSKIRELILAMTLVVVGIQTMFSSFFISLLFLERK